eukprot:s9637_g1.t1
MVKRFGGGLRELSLERVKEYWGDVEKLPTLVKSMHQKKPMQVKYGSSNNANTYKIEPKEVAKYHLAWVNYAPTSGKYKNATYSQNHFCLHTYLQRNPQAKEEEAVKEDEEQQEDEEEQEEQEEQDDKQEEPEEEGEDDEATLEASVTLKQKKKAGWGDRDFGG